MYRERPSIIPGAVVWASVSSGADTLILPDGCIDVIVIDGSPVLAGPDAVARSHRSPTGSVATGLRFAPGQAASMFGLDAAEFVGRSIGLSDVTAVVGRSASSVGEQVADAADPGAVLESMFQERAAQAADPVREAVVDLLRAGSSVGDVGNRVGLSARHLQRRCQRWFGYGPKHLSTVLRLQRALVVARSGSSAAATANAAGYSDQSHLSRDTRRLAGITYSDLMGQFSSGA